MECDSPLCELAKSASLYRTQSLYLFPPYASLRTHTADGSCYTRTLSLIVGQMQQSLSTKGRVPSNVTLVLNAQPFNVDGEFGDWRTKLRTRICICSRLHGKARSATDELWELNPLVGTKK